MAPSGSPNRRRHGLHGLWRCCHAGIPLVLVLVPVPVPSWEINSGALLTNPDFQAYARAFGVPAWRVETADGLRGALREAPGAEKPALIEVMSDIGKDYPPYEFHQPRQR
jgi:thiamine pyrophosphate-dependent enzyme